MKPDRRLFLAGASLSLGYALLPGRVMAASPHRFRHGAFDVTVLSDGHFRLPAEVVAPDAMPAEWADIEKRLDGRSRTIEAKCNIPLIRTANDLILVDVGGGGKFQPTEGQLESAFTAGGHDPKAVTKVLLTHAHPDHLWGMLGVEGKPRFPNAIYYLGAAEWNFWMDPDYASNLPEVLHPFARGSQRDLAAIRERIVTIKDGDELAPGIHAMATPGHTPGHFSYALAGPRTLVVTGDVVTNEIVSFEHPAWRFGNDTDKQAAIASRQRFVDQSAADRFQLLGYHFVYPGLGVVERRGSAFRFVAEA